jgi:hypothetical protein
MSKEQIDPLAAARVLQAIIDARHGLSRMLISAQKHNKGEPATESVGHVTALHSYIRTVDTAIWGDDEGKGGVIIRELERGSDAGNP